MMRFSLEGGLSPALVDELHREVLSLARAASISPALLPVAALVVEEICTNIMEHSNATWLEVSLGRKDDRVWVKVGDNGQPFNPCDAILAQGHLKLEDFQERRLGLYMVKQLSSTVRCGRDGQGNNRVEFEFDPDAPAGDA